MPVDVSFGIERAAYYLPEKKDDVFQWGEKTKTDPVIIHQIRENGCLYYREAMEETSIFDMSSYAIAKLFAANDIDPCSIDLIIYTHTLPYSFPAMPLSLIQMIKTAFDLKKARGLAIGEQACGSIYLMLRLIRNQMSLDTTLNRVLCITADKVLGEEYRNLGNRALTSDGASAFIVTRNAKHNVIRSVVASFDARYYGGIAADSKLLNWRDQNYCMILCKLINQAIERSGLDRDAFSKLLPSNFQLPHMRQITRLLKMAPEILFSENMESKGHAYNADTAINLVDFAENANHLGSNVISYGSGSSGCFAAMTLENLSRFN